MIAETLRTAMLNILRIDPYDIPHRTNPPAQRWLIASRGGPGGAHLGISDKAVSVDTEVKAVPDNLSEQNSIVAILAKAKSDAPQFLMLRHLPATFQCPVAFSRQMAWLN